MVGDGAEFDILRADENLHFLAIQKGACCLGGHHKAMGGDVAGWRMHLGHEMRRTPNKARDKGRSGCAVDFFWRPDLFNTTLRHHHNTIGNTQCLFLVMGHHNRRHAKPLLQGSDFLPQVKPHNGIQR